VVRLGAAGALGATAAGRAGAQPLAPPLLRLVLPHDPSTLDPQRAVAPVDRAVARQLWEPLFRFGAGPEPLPAGAQDARPDADAAVWQIRLRPELSWPDGTSLQAADFVRGWQRLMDRAVPDELFAPFRTVRAAGLVRTALAGPEALDFRAVAPDTIEVGLDGPGAHFRHVAALWLGAPAPPPGGAGAGNGPFLLLGHDTGRLRLAPNPAYPGGPPAVAVEILTGSGAVGDALTDLAASGAAGRPALADVVPVPDDLTVAVLADPRLAALAVRQTRPATTWLTCNVDRPPLDRPLVRRALAAAVDREAYVDTALGGAAIPAYSLLPPGCPGHDPEAGTAYRAHSGAAAALGAAGVDPAAVAALRLTVPATDAGRRAGTAVVDSIARHLGVRPGLDEIDRYAYVRALEQRRFDLAIGGWESPYPDPEGWFWLPFGDQKAENRTGWSSRPLDALWRRADAEVDPEARLALYGAAQQILLEEMPVIFLAHPQRVAVVHPRVAGLTASVMDELTGTAALRDLRLDAPE
jgi:oligopeptide transport system substrate-binding protein